MQQKVAVSWLVSAALFGVAGFLSNPDYYLWALATLLFLAMAYSQLEVAASKHVVLVAYFAIAAYSFVVGRLLFGHGQLTNGGVLAMFVVLPVVGYLVWRIYKIEASAP